MNWKKNDINNIHNNNNNICNNNIYNNNINNVNTNRNSNINTKYIVIKINNIKNIIYYSYYY